MSIRRFFFLFFVLLLVGFTFVSHADTQQSVVFVTIAPQAECVETIGGDFLKVRVLVPAGASPEVYMPAPKEIAELGRASLYICIGVPCEAALLPKVTRLFPKLRVLEGTRGMEIRAISSQEEAGHHGHHHGDGLRDPHVWLDPLNMAIYTENVVQELCRLFPSHEEQFLINAQKYLRRISEVHEECMKKLLPFTGTRVLVFHPAFGYFLERYHLEQRTIEEEGKAPTGRRLAELIGQVRAADTRVVFVQPQFNKKTAEVIAREIGGVVVPIDPLPRQYIEGIRAICDAIVNNAKK